MSPRFDEIEARALSLPAEERLQLAGTLWRSVAEEAHAEPGLLPLSDEERAELDRRLADYEVHPETSVSWDEVKSGLRRHG